MDKGDKILELDAVYKDYIDKGNDVLKEMSTLRTEIELPLRVDKYEGKYFKCKNSFGKDGEHWYIYVYCIECIDENLAMLDIFETDITGGSSFQANKRDYYKFCQEEVTEKEFLFARNEFLLLMNNMKS